MTNSLRLFGSWNYGYFRQTGTLGGADSVAGPDVNTGRTTDPNTLRADAGSVNPLSIWTFGGDWTPTAKLVVSARYGYFFNNTEQRGTPVGHPLRIPDTRSTPPASIWPVRPFPASSFNTSGFANIPSNLATAYDAYKRKGFNVDASYFVHFAGTHTFKTGYFRSTQSDDVLKTFNGGAVNLYLGQSYAAGHQQHDLRRDHGVEQGELRQIGLPGPLRLLHRRHRRGQHRWRPAVRAGVLLPGQLAGRPRI